MKLRLLGYNAVTPLPVKETAEAGFGPFPVVTSPDSDSGGEMKPSQDVVDFKNFLARHERGQNETVQPVAVAS